MSRRFCRTKIVTTSDPATDHDNSPKKIITAGMNVVRMNFPHGSSEDHELRASRVREIAAKPGRHVAILGDLQGPKIRVFIFKEGKVFLNVGDKFLLGANLSRGRDDREKVGIDYKGLSADVVPGDTLLLGDGHVQLKALEVQDMKVFAKVTVGDSLSNNKGISKLGGGLSAEASAEKDKVDIITAARISVDYLVVSLPCYGGDLNYARRLTCDVGCDARVVAKVEHAETVCDQNAMDNIILASDVVMVICGDLGIEVDDPELIGIQKALTRRTRQLNRAIVATTQMMESMIINPIPTRVEAVDVANVVLDGIDAVVLSAETVTGQYPMETVTAMACVCLDVERIPSINVSGHRLDVQSNNAEEAIAMSAMYIANHLRGITAIIAMTESGRIALMTPRISSGLPIFTISRHERTLSLTSLYRGVTSIHFDSEIDGVVTASEAVSLLHDKGYLVSGDLVIVTQNDVISIIGSTNTTRILTTE